jgi:hypothetical protein
VGFDGIKVHSMNGFLIGQFLVVTAMSATVGEEWVGLWVVFEYILGLCIAGFIVHAGE